MTKTLTFIPSGGLANRMRAIAGALNLYQHTGIEANVVWFRDSGLNAKFMDIFEPVNIKGLTIRESRFIDLITIDRARRKNFYAPLLYQKFIFDKRIDEKTMWLLKKQEFDFDKWATEGRKLYMSSYHAFGHFDDFDALIQQLFIPVPVIQNKIDSFVSQFAERTIGIHIRRTDNIESIKGSPLEKFLEIVDKEIYQDNTVKVFLATDDEPTKDEFRSKYGDRVITPSVPASRNSLEGIQDGIVDMWTLAATDIIYGSKGSSYSQMAASIGGNNLVIVE